MARKAATDELGAWLELELERLGVSSPMQRRATRHALAERLTRAMRGQIDDLKGLSPAEKVVIDPNYRVLTPYLDVQTKLQHLSEDVAMLQVREKATTVRESYDQRLARRDEKILKLSTRVHDLTEELRDIRVRSERTQRKLEDVLLERSMELAEVKQRCEHAETRLQQLLAPSLAKPSAISQKYEPPAMRSLDAQLAATRVPVPQTPPPAASSSSSIKPTPTPRRNSALAAEIMGDPVGELARHGSPPQPPLSPWTHAPLAAQIAGGLINDSDKMLPVPHPVNHMPAPESWRAHPHLPSYVPRLD